MTPFIPFVSAYTTRTITVAGKANILERFSENIARAIEHKAKRGETSVEITFSKIHDTMRYGGDHLPLTTTPTHYYKIFKKEIMETLERLGYHINMESKDDNGTITEFNITIKWD